MAKPTRKPTRTQTRTQARTRPRRPVSERTRDEILLAAARALSARGLKQARMEDIAREAGFTAPALYSYFASKDDMIQALRVKVRSEFLRPFRAPVGPRLGFRARVTMLVHQVLDLADRWRDLFLVFLALDDARHPGGMHTHADFLEDVAAWFERAATGGELEGKDAGEIALVFTGITGGFFRRWLSRGAQERLADATGTIVEYFFEGIGRRAPRRRRSLATGDR